MAKLAQKIEELNNSVETDVLSLHQLLQKEQKRLNDEFDVIQQDIAKKIDKRRMKGAEDFKKLIDDFDNSKEVESDAVDAWAGKTAKEIQARFTAKQNRDKAKELGINVNKKAPQKGFLTEKEISELIFQELKG